MRIAILVMTLVVAAVAQAPTTTTKSPGLLDTIGSIFSQAASAFGNTFSEYLKSAGANLLDSVLPNLAGQLLSGGVSSLLQTAVQTGQATTVSTGKRDLTDDLQQMQREFEAAVHQAEQRAGGLGLAVNSLVHNLLNGIVTPQEYLKILPDISTNAEGILHNLSEDLLHSVFHLMGNKRQALNLNNFMTVLQNLEAKGAALADQLEQELVALAYPQNLKILRLLQDLGLGH